MAYGAIREKTRLTLDGETFYECFDRQTVNTMKDRLIKAGIDEGRLKVTTRMPNL